MIILFHYFIPLYRALEDTPFIIKDRGVIRIKGKGKMRTYFLSGRETMDQENGTKTAAGSKSTDDEKSAGPADFGKTKNHLLRSSKVCTVL